MSASHHIPSRLSVAREITGTWSLSDARYCLDLRSKADYDKGHLIPSASVPLDTLESRFSQLPPKNGGASFLVVSDENALFRGERIGEFLRDRGWSVEGILELSTSSTEIDEYWEYARTMGVFGTGNQGKQLLFKPCPALGAWIDWIERDFLEGSENDTPRAQRLIWDIGCGSGRDMGFLASRTNFKWSLVGLDNWAKALERSEIMVNSIDPSRLHSLIHAEINFDSGEIIPLTSSSSAKLREVMNRKVALVLIIRSFPKGLFKDLHLFVDRGGYLIFSHFTNPIEGELEYVSPPREKRVSVGEVESMLNSAGEQWRILQNSRGKSENGRPMWNIVAKRR
jgi:SAM-dependent methyltransferase